MIAFTVPGKPIPKARPRTVTNQRGTRMTYTPGKCKAFERDVAWEAKRAKVRIHDGLVAMTLRFIGCGPQGDADNLAKSILDGLNGIAYVDDRQVEELHIFVDRHAKPPRTEVEIRTKGER